MRMLFQKILFAILVCVAVVGLIRLIQLTSVRLTSKRISCPRCDVVILDLDVLRADAIRCGVNTITPNLCKLVRKGTNFTNAYSQSYWTLPSSLSTYTSLYPNVNNVWDERQGSIAQDSITLALLLHDQGYATYYLGENNDALLTKNNGGLRGYIYTNTNYTRDDNPLNSYKKIPINIHQPILFHMNTEWLHIPYLLNAGAVPETKMQKPKGLPVNQYEFYPIFMNYLVLHAADVFTKETIEQNPNIFQSDLSVRGQKVVDFMTALSDQHNYVDLKTSWTPYSAAYMQFINPRNPQNIAYLHMMYESKVRELDASLSDFIDYLMQPDIASHTIVVITSSHGEAFGEHGTLAHLSVPYNELFHVPLVIIYPNGLGTKVYSVVENIDIFPTLADLAASATPSHLQGISLVPLLSGISKQTKSYAISMNENNEYVIQTGRYALVLYRDQRLAPELYDLIYDPTEQHDLVSRYPDIVKRYTYLFQQSRVAPELFLPTTEPLVPSTINKKDLIRSGYF